MKRMQSFKYELNPNGKQRQNMYRASGCCRFVYNKALFLQKENHKLGNKFISLYAMQSNLPLWKEEFVWLSEAPSQALQSALRGLDNAYKNFFAGRANQPTFKKREHVVNFHYPQKFILDQINSRIYLPKIGWVRYHNSREALGVVKNATVSCKADRWFVSIQTEREHTPIQLPVSIIGIDVGVSRFVTMSDGAFYEPSNSFKKKEKKLARYQKKMARKIKGSANYKKAKKQVQKVHFEIANSRNDFLHKISTSISKNHTVVCIENLKVKEMTKSNPGRRNLNKSILDQGWGEFRRQLEYKIGWAGGIVLAVPPYYTSQTCPNCNHISSDNRKMQSHFSCVVCGYKNNADVVGAINVLARGHRVLACGVSSDTMKQEPTEVTSLF